MATLHFACLHDVPDLIPSAAALLRAQWGGSLPSHLAKLTRSSPRLPCHIIATAGPGETDVLVHASLHASADPADVILQSLVVSPARRRQGLGRLMLEHAEAEAACRGFGYVALCTPDQVPFYQACGYTVCEPSNLDAPVMRAAGGASVALLEGLLASRTERLHTESGSGSGGSDTGAAGGSGAPVVQTWLRKRLRAFPEDATPVPVEEVRRVVQRHVGSGSWEPPLSARTAPAAAAASPLAATAAAIAAGACDAADAHGTCTRSASRRSGRWNAVPWCRQIGPSCGLTAVLMIAEYAAARSAAGATVDSACDSLIPASLPSVCVVAGAAAAGTRGAGDAGIPPRLSAFAATPLQYTVTADAPDNDAADGGWSVVLESIRPGSAAGCSSEAFAAPHTLRGSLLQAARDAGFTRDGEIFSLRHMCALLRDCCGAACTVVDVAAPAVGSAGDARASAADAGAHGSVVAGAVESDADKHVVTPSGSTAATAAAVEAAIIDAVDAGDVLLVAYDTDGTRGHVPVLKGGASAHWGIITGYIAGGVADASGGLAVILQHSLSAAPVVCSVAQLLGSNQQLRAANHRKMATSGWVVGADGPQLAGVLRVHL